MSSGVIRDFNESEKFPTDIGGTLTQLLTLVVAQCKVKDLGQETQREGALFIDKMMMTILTFLDDGEKKDAFARATGGLFEAEVGLTAFLEKNKIASGPVGSQVQALHKSIARMDVIRNSTFIQPGYALMDLITVATLVMLQMCQFAAGEFVAMCNIFVYSTLFIYLNFLVRDLDNPLDYTENYNVSCYCQQSPAYTGTQAYTHGTSINFKTLTIGFGGQIRRITGTYSSSFDASTPLLMEE